LHNRPKVPEEWTVESPIGLLPKKWPPRAAPDMQFNSRATFTWSGDVHPFHSLQASWAARAAGDPDHCTPFEPSYHILLLLHPSPTQYLRTPSVGLGPCRGAQTCSQETLRGSSTPACQVAVCRCSCTRNKPCRLQSPLQDSTSRVHSRWCRHRHSSLARQACPFPGDVAGAACGKHAQSTQTSLHHRRRDTGLLPWENLLSPAFLPMRSEMTEQGSRQWCRSAQRSSTSILRQPSSCFQPSFLFRFAPPQIEEKNLKKRKKLGGRNCGRNPKNQEIKAAFDVAVLLPSTLQAVLHIIV
jgi:hypothetical protein